MRQIKRSKKVIESAIKALSEPKKKQYLIHFKSYSYDNFYMLNDQI